MTVLNVGSLNIDHVYRVETIARPGETVASSDYRRFAGGKGANQSIALARAGATVLHAGAVGPEGQWLRRTLRDDGVDVRHVRVLDEPGGHAVIQVETSGQNSIVIYGGANHRIDVGRIRDVLSDRGSGDVLLLQNEINGVGDLISAGSDAGLRVVLNPAPMTAQVADYPLEHVDMLIVNEHEGRALCERLDAAADDVLESLRQRFPDTDICLTMGAAGAVLQRAGGALTRREAPRVHALDTTAAGDTFIGYLLASLGSGADDGTALWRACRAAALSVTKAGAVDSIPFACDIDDG